ncbi:PREDICTED: elongation of very long chain fatty acids protein AAEL008004-like [Dinoponera quadriceps]|uniref:Elongation of very long chain fatty acids protein n=1 Tax=Dinoponera quadriceps TaxID=609295 RepID=A0A6P3X5I1_DINQU|nr:PREDICTED: elongation of very long chain fatty acids protein AAEL008004-like [Dinoponera quadriceps]
MVLEQFINYFLGDPDPKLREWPMMSSGYPLIIITLGYLYFIYIAGPRYMKDRPPYKLRTFILVYNIFQILANAWIVKEHIRGGWFTEYGFILAWKPDIDSPNAQVLTNAFWWLILLKFFDYVETCTYVLRKKQKQISILHVYHHISVVIILWTTFRYYWDTRFTFLPLINCSVHVLMYTYYLSAACGPKVQQIVAPFKRYMTEMQMVQLLFLLAYLLQVLHPSCDLPRGYRIVYALNGNVIIILFLFYNFYRESYVKKEITKQKS